MFDIDKIYIGKIYTTLNSSIISLDSFCDEYEIECEPIKITALCKISDSKSYYNEYMDVLNDKYYMDEFFSTNKQNLFVNTKDKLIPLSTFFKMSNIKYDQKMISKEELRALLTNIFNKYNDENFNFGRRILRKEKIIIVDIKKALFMVKIMPNKLEEMIELLYKKGLKIEQFKILMHSDNFSSYFPNNKNQENVVAMVLSGQDVLNKLNKMELNHNNSIYIPSNIEEIKKEYDKFFCQKQKRI